MCSRILDILAILLSAYFLTYLPKVQTSGVFEIRIYNFRNDKSYNSCLKPCRSLFKVCVNQYEEDNSTRSPPRCKFLTIGLAQEKNAAFYFSVDFKKQDYFSYTIEAWHDTSFVIPNYGYRNSWKAPLEFFRKEFFGDNWFRYRHKKLDYAFRFTCDMFGEDCTHFCFASSNSLGHYTCSQTGTRVCREGWKGEFCDSALCLPECHPSNGYCDRPGECRCMLGWQGPFCNQYLDFCAHYNPCKNGAVCNNTGDGHYTCNCVGTYTGVNCQHGSEDAQQAVACPANPCMNSGTCVMNQDSFLCMCQPGFTGFNCGTEIDECHSSPCQNGVASDSREEGNDPGMSRSKLLRMIAQMTPGQDEATTNKDGGLRTADLLIIGLEGVAILLLIICILILLCPRRASHQQPQQNTLTRNRNRYVTSSGSEDGKIFINIKIHDYLDSV